MCIIILIPYLQKFQHAHRPTTCQSQIVQRVAIESKKFNFNWLTSKSRKHNKQNGCVIHWITSSFTKTPSGLEFTSFFSSITQRCKRTKYNRRNLSQKLDSTFTKAAKRAKSRKSMFYRVCSQINFKKMPRNIVIFAVIWLCEERFDTKKGKNMTYFIDPVIGSKIHTYKQETCMIQW